MKPFAWTGESPKIEMLIKTMEEQNHDYVNRKVWFGGLSVQAECGASGLGSQYLGVLSQIHVSVSVCSVGESSCG